MKKNAVPYQKKILVCTKQGEAVCCGNHQAEEVFRKLRELAKEKGVHPRFRVGQAKCLGQCEKGVNIMVFPDGQWYSEVRLADLPQIAEECFKEISPAVSTYLPNPK
jgi:(2Fe-2S) ferredoxin